MFRYDLSGVSAKIHQGVLISEEDRCIRTTAVLHV